MKRNNGSQSSSRTPKRRERGGDKRLALEKKSPAFSSKLNYEIEKESVALDIILKRKKIEFYDSLYCKNCEELLLGEDVWRFEGLQGFYCSRECALKALRTCENCEKTIEGNKVFIGSQGNTYCSSGCLRAKEGV